MDINYKILWFEDTDESFETLSRRTERYVNSRNLRCQINRIWGASDFDISHIDLNTYEVLVVDLRLSDNSKGYEIIEAIRNGNYVNDVLFYSAEGLDALNDIMKQRCLEGVFVTDRNHKIFIPKIKQLIDKSIRRSENVINIRGVVMDETSEFDSQMCEIINAIQGTMKEEEIKDIKLYIADKLLTKRVDDITSLANTYKYNGEWKISDVIAENDFSSMMKAKLLNYIFNLDSNGAVTKVIADCKSFLPQAFGEKKVKFVSAYDDEILKFRNKLAHVKKLNAESPIFIGTINGVDYHCDADFCSMLRASLIKYGDWFRIVYDSIINI